MIKVTVEIVTDKRTQTVARLNITNLDGPYLGETEYARYSADFMYTQGDQAKLLTRVIEGFPRKKTNALGLVLAALSKLTDKELAYAEATLPTDLARELTTDGESVQGWFSRLRNH
jgi:hypothetical protein